MCVGVCVNNCQEKKNTRETCGLCVNINCHMYIYMYVHHQYTKHEKRYKTCVWITHLLLCKQWICLWRTILGEKDVCESCILDPRLMHVCVCVYCVWFVCVCAFAMLLNYVCWCACYNLYIYVNMYIHVYWSKGRKCLRNICWFHSKVCCCVQTSTRNT